MPLAQLVLPAQQAQQVQQAPKVDKVFKVLIDRTEGDYYIARTEGDSPEIDNEVLIPVAGNKLKAGTFEEVTVISAESFDLYAEPLNRLGQRRK